MDDKIFRFSDDEWVSPELRAFFAYEPTRKAIEGLADRHDLTEEQKGHLFLIVREVVLGKLSDDEVADALVAATGIDEDKSIDLQSDLYAEVLFDAADLLREQNEIYKDLHPEEFLPPQPPPVDPHEELAKEVAAKSGLSPADPVLRHRLEMIAVARLKDVRDEAETKAMLEKPAKTGGMGFTPENAAAFLVFVNEALPKVAEVKEAAKKREEEHGTKISEAMAARDRRVKELTDRFAQASTWQPSEAAPAEPEKPAELPPEMRPAETAPTFTKDDFILDTAKDAQEVAAMQEEAPKKVDTQEVVDAASLLDSVVDEAVASSGVPFENDDLKRRFRTLVALFFRDLRDDLETKSKFTMPAASGGMGMTDADADRIIGLLKTKNADYRLKLTGKAADDKAKYVAERTEKVMTGTATEQKKEDAALEQRFADLLHKSGTTPQQPPASAAPAPAMPPQPPRVVPVISVGKPPASVPVASAPSSGPGAVVPPPAPAMPPQPLSTPPTPLSPSPTGQKPVVADVKFVPKLTGPVEELRKLTVKDFRRLSKDPREATLKIKDKIDLLMERSFDVKTQGIKAWQESEPNKLYLEILRRSLEGKPVVDVIAELEKKGEPVLSKAEFDAIMDLNRKVRFG